MPRHSAILNLGGPLADGDHIEEMPLSTLRVVALGVTHPPRSTQLRRGFCLARWLEKHRTNRIPFSHKSQTTAPAVGLL
jgi:hypothetical protein